VIGSWSVAHASEDNLAARVAELEDVVARLRAALDKQRAELARKDGALIWQKDRIAEGEKALEDAGRRQKRQTAPFSKGDPKPEPKRPGEPPLPTGHSSAQKEGRWLGYP